MSEKEKPQVKWYDEDEPKIQKKWRPAIAWMYIGICIFDFVLSPVLMLVFFNKEWTPSTIANNGIFHWTMGAILGVYTFHFLDTDNI